MFLTQKQSTKRKSSDVTGDSISYRRDVRKRKMETAGEMAESAQENTSPNMMTDGKLLHQVIREVRVLLNKNIVKNYFTSKLLGNARVKTENDSDVELTQEKQQERTTRVDALLEVVSVKQEPGIEQPIFVECKTGSTDPADDNTHLLFPENSSYNIAPTFESESAVKSENLDEMMPPVDEQLSVNSDGCEIGAEDLDDEKNISIYEEPVASVPRLCNSKNEADGNTSSDIDVDNYCGLKADEEPVASVPSLCSSTNEPDGDTSSDIDVENYSELEADESTMHAVNAAPKKRKYLKKSKRESKVGRLPAKIFRCDDCNYRTNAKTKIQLHILTEHGSGLDVTFCSKCGTIFEKVNTLQRHEAFCGLLAYKCKYCEKSGMNSNFIKEHVRLHHSEELGSKTIDEVYEEIIIERRAHRGEIIRLLYEP